MKKYEWITFFEANSELVTFLGVLGRILMAAFLNAYIGVNQRLYRHRLTLMSTEGDAYIDMRRCLYKR